MSRPLAKIMVFLLAIMLSFGALTLSSCTSRQSVDYYRIVLLSDPHLPVKKFEITDPAKQKKIVEAKNKVADDINHWQDVGEIAVLGDVVGDVGSPGEYAYAAQYFSQFHKPVAFIVGNHDYIYQDAPGPGGRYVKGNANSRMVKLNRFKETFGLSELFYSQRVGNYLLIFLSVDSLDSLYLTQISDRQLSWLRETLKQNPKNPTIIFFHAPLEGTLSNYNKYANTPNFIAQPAPAIDEIIRGNPQIVLWVSGHTHTPANNPDYASARNLYDGRMLNIHNPDMNREVIWTNSLFLYPDKIVIRTFNHNREIWMDELDRTVPIHMGG